MRSRKPILNSRTVHALARFMACASVLCPPLAQAGSAAGAMATWREFSLWLAIGALALAFVLVVWATVAHHQRRGATPPAFHRSIWTELLWALAPWLMVLLIAFAATLVALGSR